MIQQSLIRITVGKVLLSSLILFIIIISILQCSPFLSTISKPKHFASVDTMEIFDPVTYKSEIKIISTEYDYYTDIPELPYLKTCESKNLKERNRCSKSTIVNNIKNDHKVIAELNKLGRDLNVEISFTVQDDGLLTRTFINIFSGNEGLDVSIANSFNNQQYKFEPGRVKGIPVYVELKIPIELKK